MLPIVTTSHILSDVLADLQLLLYLVPQHVNNSCLQLPWVEHGVLLSSPISTPAPLPSSSGAIKASAASLLATATPTSGCNLMGATPQVGCTYAVASGYLNQKLMLHTCPPQRLVPAAAAEPVCGLQGVTHAASQTPTAAPTATCRSTPPTWLLQYLGLSITQLPPAGDPVLSP